MRQHTALWHDLKQTAAVLLGWIRASAIYVCRCGWSVCRGSGSSSPSCVSPESSSCLPPSSSAPHPLTTETCADSTRTTPTFATSKFDCACLCTWGGQLPCTTFTFFLSSFFFSLPRRRFLNQPGCPITWRMRRERSSSPCLWGSTRVAEPAWPSAAPCSSVAQVKVSYDTWRADFGRNNTWRRCSGLGLWSCCQEISKHNDYFVVSQHVCTVQVFICYLIGLVKGKKRKNVRITDSSLWG